MLVKSNISLSEPCEDNTQNRAMRAPKMIRSNLSSLLMVSEMSSLIMASISTVKPVASARFGLQISSMREPSPAMNLENHAVVVGLLVTCLHPGSEESMAKPVKAFENELSQKFPQQDLHMPFDSNHDIFTFLAE